MKDRSIKRAQILALTAVLIITAGMAAAPVKDAISPLLSKSFQAWQRHSPTAKTVVDMTDTEVGLQSRSAEVESAAIGAPDVLSYSPGKGFVHSKSKGDKDNDSRGWTDYAGRRFSGVGSTGSSGLSSGHDTFSALRAAGSISISANRRSDSQLNPSTSQTSVRGASSAAGVSNSGGGSGNGGGAAKAGDDKGKDDANKDLFGEHKSGLGDLNGKKNGLKNGPHAGGLGAHTVATNPEPSTLFLFGTGIAAVAGALRRRLR